MGLLEMGRREVRRALNRRVRRGSLRECCIISLVGRIKLGWGLIW